MTAGPKVYFFSDAHLGIGPRSDERAKEDRLLAFLDCIRHDAAQVFILGDLFDAWIEYRTVIPKGFHRILAKLDEMAHNGIAIHYLVGNHDCWTRDYFSNEIGMETHLDAFGMMIQGRKVYLHHGDGLANNDTGYKILKNILRNRALVWLYTWIHPDLGITLARSSSKTSRQYTSGKKYGEEDGMMAFARKKIDEGFDIVVMGHRHRPIEQKFGHGWYINLGDWLTHNTYAEMQDAAISLKYWKQ